MCRRHNSAEHVFPPVIADGAKRAPARAELYLILELEDYALLAGASLGFVALPIVMFVTLRVDWSGSGAGARPAPQGA